MTDNQFKGSTFSDDSEMVDGKSLAFGTDRDIEKEYDSTGDFVKVTKDTIEKRDMALLDDFSLVAYWPFNEGSGTNVADISGYGNDGTITPGAGVWGGKGPSIASFHFDALASLVNCGSAPELDNIEKQTMAGWVNVDGVGENSEGRIFGKNVRALYVQATEELVFRSGHDGTNGFWSTNSNALTHGARHFVVVTYDKSSVANDPIIYVDGQSVTVNEDVTPVGNPDSDSSLDFIIGNNSTAVRTFDGDISEVMVFDRILSAIEVQRLYKATSASPTFQSLTVGDGTNQATFASDGELTLAGTARVLQHVTIPVSNAVGGGSAPTEAVVGNFAVLQFTNTSVKTAYVIFHIPIDWAVGTDMLLHVHWAPVTGAAGDVVWDIDYKAVASEANEVISGAGTNLTVTDSTQSLQDELLESADMTISGAALASEDTLGICISRDTTDGADTYGAAASLVLLEIKYIADKLGEAT